jgi:hypothetical protein
MSSAQIFSAVCKNFGAVFPPLFRWDGDQNGVTLKGTGQVVHTELAGINWGAVFSGNVQVTAKTSTGFTFKALQGHPDFPGTISFSITRRNGRATLSVHGLIHHDPPRGGWAYKGLTESLWGAFAQNISGSILHNAHGRPFVQ